MAGSMQWHAAGVLVSHKRRCVQGDIVDTSLSLSRHQGDGDDGGMSLLVSLDGLSPLALSEKASDLEARVQALMAAEAQELIRGQALRIIGPGAAAPHMQALAGGQGHTSTRNALSEAEEAGD